MLGIRRVVFGVTFLLAILITTTANNELHVEETKSNGCVDCVTELINEDDPLLFISTLDGTFLAVNHRDGKVLWKFKEEAAVKVPVDKKNSLSPMFLPDPKDGSLYMLNSDNPTDLKKLQFTIQQLVASSPCRSTDGIFYSGKKIDNWFMVDWRTGDKRVLFDPDSAEKVCPLMSRNSMFLGRTEYNLIIHDITRKENKWNVTFYDYSSKIMSLDKVKNYENIYYSGSSTGKFAVVKNTGDGSFFWETDFGSPVIGVYTRDADGLLSLPFTTMDDNSMQLISLELNKRIQHFPTLYIGEHKHGLYALPATATAGSPILLINGPAGDDTIPAPVIAADDSMALLGYYKMPEYGNERFQIAGRSDAVIEMNGQGSLPRNSSLRKTLKTTAVQTEEETAESNTKLDRYIFRQLIYLSVDYVMSPHNMEMKIFMVTMLMMMVLMFVYFRNKVLQVQQGSSSGFSRQGAYSGTVTAIAEELPDGCTRVGKILFDPYEILGKGCEGTFVFKGQFDNRQVAVKRLLPECFTVADREVCLLRESDQHPNVIRYFCMEQDKQFRYIALELCSATLQDYVEKGTMSEFITPTEALAQAIAGLEHLHSLNIVHRDLKPHNVLLSYPSPQENRVRAMISDFGLCKKLQTGRESFSRKSGITGTDGWIAPEMMHGKNRTTAAVDIFSMGCVFYYVLSKGRHPFGDSLSRQANIVNGDYELNEIVDDVYELWSHLITKMVTVDPADRPPVAVIKNHPAFWNGDQILTFLQDVSDRIEKEDLNSKVLMELETGNSFVLNGDWRDMIEQEIADDLRKYRSYRADSVRDLLRALRNKKHHYRELSETVRNILGSIPDKFVKYWMDKFPKLVLHTWLAMQCVNDEDAFRKYYCNSYTFPRIHDGVVPQWIVQSVNLSPRWRIHNKINNQKFGTSRYSADRSNSPFFSLYANKGTEYNWRYRPKVSVVDAPSDDVVLEIGGKTDDPLPPSVMANEDDTSDLIVDEATDNEQENVKPISFESNAADVNSAESVIPDDGGLKSTRHRHRPRHRHKKKHNAACEAVVSQIVLNSN